MPSLASEIEAVTREIAIRIANARYRLDALSAVQQVSEDNDLGQVTAMLQKKETDISLLESDASIIAWKIDQLRSIWNEIKEKKLELPGNTVLFEVDQQRPLHERDANTVPTFEVNPHFIYALQDKKTYKEIDSTELIPEEDIKAGSVFLSVGIFRNSGKRRVVGWVPGRGQVNVSDGDIGRYDEIKDNVQ